MACGTRLLYGLGKTGSGSVHLCEVPKMRTKDKSVFADPKPTVWRAGPDYCMDWEKTGSGSVHLCGVPKMRTKDKSVFAGVR